MAGVRRRQDGTQGGACQHSPTSDFALGVAGANANWSAVLAQWQASSCTSSARFAHKWRKEPAGSVKPFVPILKGWLVHFGKIERF